jgi:hypothetical protein
MQKNNIINFISESLKRNKKKQKEYSFGNAYVFIKDPLPENINIQHVLGVVEEKIPLAMREMIESVMVGNFEEFEDRQINAMYKDGSIYLTNAQTDNNDMIDDMVHEIAHAVEDQFGYDIYALDNKLVSEFKMKRLQLKRLLEDAGFETQGYDFENVEYVQEYDDYLLHTVGYPTLASLCIGIFPTAYSPTSIREYFATGFEAYFLGDRAYLKKMCPVLYRKIKEITNYD